MDAHITLSKRCDECGKHTDGLMTCYFLDDSTIKLCPDGLEKDGSFCYGCGMFCAGMESFDFAHPGYCDNCWDSIQSDFGDLDEDYSDPCSDPYYDPMFYEDDDEEMDCNQTKNLP